jgi:glycosyltransferase involved in cell wall biosynthesis
VLEAMACGVPVVGSDISAFRGYAAGAAALVNPHDP